MVDDVVMILGLGVDLVEVARFERESRHDPGFLDEILLASELDRCRRTRRPHSSHAAHFAAKEALLKALGTGRSGRLSWHDLEVVAGDQRTPALALSGEAARVAAEMGVDEVRLALATTTKHAVAMVVLAGRARRQGRSGGR